MKLKYSSQSPSERCTRSVGGAAVDRGGARTWLERRRRRDGAAQRATGGRRETRSTSARRDASPPAESRTDTHAHRKVQGKLCVLPYLSALENPIVLERCNPLPCRQSPYLRPAISIVTSLWPPYGIGQATIFLPCGFFLSFYLSFFSSPNISGRRSDVYHTSTHGVALVRI